MVKTQTMLQTYLSDNTKFKLCVYWNLKPDGSYWAAHEKKLGLHRKYIDSWDYVNTASGKTITRHDEALYKQLVFAQENIIRADKILLFMNDTRPDVMKQYLIGTFVQDVNRCKYIVPDFQAVLKNYGEEEHVYVKGLPTDPLDTYPLVQKWLTKKPKTIIDYLTTKKSAA